MYRILFLLLAGFLLGTACSKDSAPDPAPADAFSRTVAPYLNLSAAAPSYRVSIPNYTKGLFQSVQPNAQLAQLGRVIFYDKHLSKDGTISCAHCHQQAHAFADPTALSTGVEGQKTTRNSMALGNIQWLGGMLGLDSVGNALLPLFWDSRAHSVSEQSRGAFTNAHEMGLTMPEVLQLVRNQPYYPWLFEQAWGDTLVDEARIFTALAHFMNGIHASHSRLDEALARLPDPFDLSSDFPGYSASENIGKAIYVQRCMSCHGSINSIQKVFEANNGLDKNYTDKGKGAISGKFYENGTFKVPGLRNIEFSAPYMHDGRFATLEEVVEHYNSGIVQGFGLHGDLLEYDPLTQSYSPLRLNLTASEKQGLVDFLKTLSDKELINDERYSDPFR
ncbi:MAG: hypothetical protein KGS48_11285 [Bacteroidetes bacterium]|nr:hypothetical protein [Bacteroidota bacterium]